MHRATLLARSAALVCGSGAAAGLVTRPAQARDGLPARLDALEQAIAQAEKLPKFRPKELDTAKEQRDQLEAAVDQLKKTTKAYDVEELRGAIKKAESVTGFNPPELSTAKKRLSAAEVRIRVGTKSML